MSEAQVGRSPFDPARDGTFKKELVTLIPHLRAFARTLTGDPTAADDLAQDAMPASCLSTIARRPCR